METLFEIFISKICILFPSSAVSGFDSFCIIIFSFIFTFWGSSTVLFKSLFLLGNLIILKASWLSIVFVGKYDISLRDIISSLFVIFLFLLIISDVLK